ncbi:MAG TPA: hypothetical protein VHD56_18405 [Tepidisphaeraceae bacterium]|nr:hypothetical protein [Tepidisphaeraceae bacterium]
MTEPIVNRHGRVGGRGIRPWLLAPKIVAVIIYVGGLATVLGLWNASDFKSLSLTDPRRTLVLDQVSRLMVFLVVPALLVALISGLALLMQHPRVFLKTPWIRVKIIALLILIPASHFYCRSCFIALRNATNQSASDSVANQLNIGFILAFAGSVCIVLIGRFKPRFGIKHRPDVQAVENY